LFTIQGRETRATKKGTAATSLASILWAARGSDYKTTPVTIVWKRKILGLVAEHIAYGGYWHIKPVQIGSRKYVDSHCRQACDTLGGVVKHCVSKM